MQERAEAEESMRFLKADCQDEACVMQNFAGIPGLIFVGVFDGHGPNGRAAAKFASHHLPQALAAQTVAMHSRSERKRLKAMREACRTVNAAMCDLKQAGFDASMSGTTACLALMCPTPRGSRILLANVGDSRCVLARRRGDGGVEAVPLTVDAKPSLPGEARRIIACGGTVQQLRDEQGKPRGAHRVFARGDNVLPGLAMSRSLGDNYAHSVGVTWEPMLSAHSLASRDLFLVLGTDGLWDMMSGDAAADFVHRYRHQRDPNLSCAEALTLEAQERWKAAHNEALVDDISVAILHFAPMPPADPEASLPRTLSRAASCNDEANALASAWQREATGNPSHRSPRPLFQYLYRTGEAVGSGDFWDNLPKDAPGSPLRRGEEEEQEAAAAAAVGSGSAGGASSSVMAMMMMNSAPSPVSASTPNSRTSASTSTSPPPSPKLPTPRRSSATAAIGIKNHLRSYAIPPSPLASPPKGVPSVAGAGRRSSSSTIVTAASLQEDHAVHGGQTTTGIQRATSLLTAESLSRHSSSSGMGAGAGMPQPGTTPSRPIPMSSHHAPASRYNISAYLMATDRAASAPVITAGLSASGGGNNVGVGSGSGSANGGKDSLANSLGGGGGGQPDVLRPIRKAYPSAATMSSVPSWDGGLSGFFGSESLPLHAHAGGVGGGNALHGGYHHHHRDGGGGGGGGVIAQGLELGADTPRSSESDPSNHRVHTRPVSKIEGRHEGKVRRGIPYSFSSAGLLSHGRPSTDSDVVSYNGGNGSRVGSLEDGGGLGVVAAVTGSPGVQSSTGRLSNNSMFMGSFSPSKGRGGGLPRAFSHGALNQYSGGGGAGGGGSGSGRQRSVNLLRPVDGGNAVVTAAGL